MDWYEHRSELRPGMVFKDYEGHVIMLDRDVPGDGTRWYVADWWKGWSYNDGQIEPGDLREKLSDDGWDKDFS